MNQEPTLKYQAEVDTATGAISFRLVMLNYTDRGEMAARLRNLAHWIEEGIITPFDAPREGLTLRWNGTEWKVLNDE